MADDGAGKERKKTQAMSLEFVNMNVATAAERQRNQKVVRSTAMKSFRRKQKSQRNEEKNAKNTRKAKDIPEDLESGPSTTANTDRPVVRKSSLAPGHEIPFQITHSESSWIAGSPSSSSSSSSISSSGEEGSFVGKTIQVIQAEPLTELKLRASAMMSPRTLLGAGRIDPFQIYPVDVHNSSHAPELIDHSVSVLWRGLRPKGDNGATSSLGAAWLKKMHERPVVMHAMLFGAQTHIDVLRSPRLSIDISVRLFHKLQTMRLLNEELKNPEQIQLDDIILAILTLSANEVETVASSGREKERSPFNSPLASMQWLDIYGSMSHLSAHTTAMRSLVARRGGLEKIELEGLAEVLSFADILGSTQSLRRPVWPLLKRTLSTEEIYIPEILKVPLRGLGKGFEDLIPLGLNETAYSVIQALVDLTIIIDCHCRGVKVIDDLTQFIDKRNAVQHQLISLASGDKLTPEEVKSTNLYESIRLATLIYSAAVTFPLPPLTGIYHRLACMLREVLDKSKFDSCWQSSSKALLWMLVLGGIAASGTNERSWYVQNLSTVSTALALSAWDQVSIELGSHLWLESACDSAGRNLWAEVINLRP